MVHSIRTALLGSALAVLAAVPAQALSISGLSIVKNPANSANVAEGNRALTSNTQVLSSGATSFSTRYSANGAADVGAFGSTLAMPLTASYSITFSVTQDPGLPYVIEITTRFTGALTTLDDAAGLGGNGVASDLSVSNLTGSWTGAGTLSGGLGLATAASLVGGSSTTGTSVGIDQSGAASIAGLGTGVPQLYTLVFGFTAQARSTCSGLCISGGDEKAYRFGAGGAADSNNLLANTTADDYPGLGSRVQSNDGHFVNVAVVPEPGTVLLMALGLAGLAGGRGSPGTARNGRSAPRR